MDYKCNRCGYTTLQKCHLVRHLQNVRQCKPLLNDVPLEDLLSELQKKANDTAYPCEYCGKQFNSRSNKSRHKKTCKKRSTVEELQKQVETLTNMVVSMQHNGTTNITNNNNIVNNIQNNIHLHGFGHETLGHLPKSFLNYCFANKDIVQLIENVHFDKECPENQNVRIKSSKNELMEYYQNGNWVISTQDRILTELIQKGYRILRTHGKRNKGGIMEEEDLEEDDYNNVLRWLEEVYEDERQQKPIKKDLLVLFLNNRPILLGKDS